jgi:Zinc carboxypeptidase.
MISFFRENAQHVDLNRSFPDFFQQNLEPEQTETQAVKSWLHSNMFVLSASLHGGALVANYPYENIKEWSKCVEHRLTCHQM